MTNKDIMVTIISEALEKPKEVIDAIIEEGLKGKPRYKLDEEVPEDEAQKMLNALREDLNVVAFWATTYNPRLRK